MEISLKNTIYTINPRRIIYIEYYLELKPGKENFLRDKEKNEIFNRFGKEAVDNFEFLESDSMYYEQEKKRFHPNSPDVEIENFQKVICIYMTDEKKLKFIIENDEEYNELKNKLEKIVGG